MGALFEGEAVGERYRRVLDYFSVAMPAPESELVHRDERELLIAVMLSAQCMDQRVNQVTPALFARYPDWASLATADETEVYGYVSSVTYPRDKARHLIETARMVVGDYGGRVPREMEGLLRLPGVGRKTANVMLAVAFGQAAMPVDTHVHRVAARLGLAVNAKTPRETERQLTDNIPTALLSRAHHWLLLFGRYTCTARNPKCGECPFADMCVGGDRD